MAGGVTTFKRERPSDWVTARLMSNFRVDDDGLRRLGLFVMAHVDVDIRLIAVAMQYEIRRERAKRELSLDDRGNISDGRARGTFKDHLRVANDWGLLLAEAYKIAQDMNEAREHLLHWNRARGLRAIYKGVDVATGEGFELVMSDVSRFNDLVPFPAYEP